MRMSRFALLATAPLALAAIVATAPHASAGDISEGSFRAGCWKADYR